MKYFSLVWAQLFRSRTRTLLTLLSVVAAFLLFGMLDSVRVAFSSGGSVEGANRLVVASRLSITQSLPIRLEANIRQVTGVRDVTYGMWFGGIYQDPKNFFPNFSVAPNYFDVYRELQIDPAQLHDWQQTRTGAIVGETLAKQF
ncbi:MAG: ABC transporter permease, partial [Stenotrophomonas sp.]